MGVYQRSAFNDQKDKSVSSIFRGWACDLFIKGSTLNTAVTQGGLSSWPEGWATPDSDWGKISRLQLVWNNW